MSTTTIIRPAFTIRNLGILAFSHGFTLWIYKHEGERADYAGDDFVRDAQGMLAVGDMVMVSDRKGAAIYSVVAGKYWPRLEKLA